MKKLSSVIMFFAFILILVSCSSSGGGSTNLSESTEQEEINPVNNQIEQGEYVLKAVTSNSEDNVFSQSIFAFKEKIESSSQGRVKVEYVGGPESIPAFEQGEAVRNGVVDISVLSAAYYASHMPEVTVLDYTTLTLEEARNGGAFDFFNQIHNEKMNAQFLNPAVILEYNFFTKVPVESMEDFKGLKIRASATYVPFLQALGAQPISLPVTEIYTALERGVIDGYALPNALSKEIGLQEIVKYKIFPNYYKSFAYVMIMNLDTWKSLPPDIQQLVQEASDYALEKQMERLDSDVAEEERIFKENGVQFMEIAEKEEYLKLSIDSAWEWMEENTGENYQKLEELFRK